MLHISKIKAYIDRFGSENTGIENGKDDTKPSCQQKFDFPLQDQTSRVMINYYGMDIRIASIINILFDANDYISSIVIAEKLGISESTLFRLLPQLEECTAPYGFADQIGRASCRERV